MKKKLSKTIKKTSRVPVGKTTQVPKAPNGGNALRTNKASHAPKAGNSNKKNGENIVKVSQGLQRKLEKKMTGVKKAIKRPAVKAAHLVRRAKSNIDVRLLTLSPGMQKTIDRIVEKIENTPGYHLEDLRTLACRVLQHANEINHNLKKKIKR